MSKVISKISTPDRILDAAVELFNDHGFSKVPAMRIATYLGISPGHLAYHFKNKTDIVLAVFPRMVKALQESMRLDSIHTPPVSVDRVIQTLHTLWHYRFFFNELTQLLVSDAKLRENYEQMEARVLGAMEQLLEERITKGDIHPIPAPNSTRFVSKCCWTLWLDWLRFEQYQHPGEKCPGGASVYDTILRSYCILQPYMTMRYVEDIIVELKKRLIPDLNSKHSAAA